MEDKNSQKVDVVTTPQKEIEDAEEAKKKEEVEKEDAELAAKASGTYGLTVVDLENLMGAYKERGKDCQDLEMINKWGGDEGMMQKLKTDSKKGITDDKFRREDFGTNEVFQEPVPSFCSFVWEALEDTMIRILIVAAIVQIILGATLSDNPETDWIDGMSIVFAVLVVTIVGSVTNYEKAKKFHELNDLQSEGTKYQIIRNGNLNNVNSDELLVGDLVNIGVGEIIPADMVVVSSNGIKIDESALTGESDTLKKEPFAKCLEEKNNGKENPPSPCLLSGTNCVEGTGQAIVIAVGDHSQKGIIRRTVDNAQENSKTPLEEKLEEIAEMIGWFGMASGAVTLVALFIRFGIQYPKDKKAYDKSKALQDLIKDYMEIDDNAKGNPYFQAESKRDLTEPKEMVSGQVLEIILLCVSIIVVAIPEGLPLAVSLSLAFSIKKLMDQNNLVRKMHSCETMGGANYICTDKTGTLTRNEMNIFKVYSPGKEILIKETMNVENAGSLTANKDKNIANIKIREPHTNYFLNEQYWNSLKIAIALNIEGAIKYLDKANAEGDMEELDTKNKTDKAFVDFLYRFKSPISEERKKYIENEEQCVRRVPFDSKRKRMMTCIKNSNFPTGYRVFSKGGAEKVKEIANKYVDLNDGSIKTLGDQELNDISDKIDSFNKDMLRSLYVAYRDISEDEFNNYEKIDSNDKAIDQHDMIFICIVGIRDSLRNGVTEAVDKCHKARVTVVMVTGDNLVTASAIAKECHILDSTVNLSNPRPEEIEEDSDLTNDPNKRDEHVRHVIEKKPKALTGNTFYSAIHGLYCASCNKDTNECKCAKTSAEAEAKKEELKKMGREEDVPVRNESIRDEDMKTFKSLTKNLRVMARSQPIHKYALVLGLRKLGYVVGVTGDGTNDAPALSKSDVGFAMFAGTDIAKDASDIIIMDNNFASIVVAIIYGRNIYDNIRKFLQFQLTVNFAACLLVFICACIGNETPLNPIEMLWVNLIMDSLGSLALATEPPYEELLDREPTRKDESIINGKMWKHIIFQSVVELILLLLLYLYAPEIIKEDNLKRQGESRILLACYGTLPGDKNDPEYIIYGTSSKWKSNVKLRRGLGPAECGKYSERQDMSVAFKGYCNAFASTTHIGVVFNVFVIYTLFNEINARVLDDSLNIFKRIHKNFFFPVITLCELGLQAIIVQFSNQAFKVVENGLTGKQWGICIGFGAITFILSIIVKFIPLDVAIQKLLDNSGKDNKVANEDDIKDSSNNSKEKLNNSKHSALNVSNQNPNQPRPNALSRAINSIGSNVINPRVQKNDNSSIRRTESYLRKNKPEVPVYNQE